MSYPEHFKAFAIGHALSQYSDKVPAWVMYDVIMALPVQGGDAVLEALGVAVWEPYEDYDIATLQRLLDSMAGAAMDVAELHLQLNKVK